MHIPDGILTPAVSIGTGVVSGCGLVWAVRTLERWPQGRLTVLTGVVAAFLFAAQMVNFPVWFGVSGHLMGGMLAAVILGPAAALVAVTAVLMVQCLLYGDGGIYALGANVLNMGLLGAVGGWLIFRSIQRLVGGERGVILGAMLGAWFSVILAAGAVAIELAVSTRISQLGTILGWMVLVHALIGLGEAMITGLVLRSVMLVRPELVLGIREERDGPEPELDRGGVVAGGLAMALGVAVFLSPLASPFHDGLEWVCERLGLGGAEASLAIPSPMADYVIPGVTGTLGLATSAAGLIGTLLVFGLGWLLTRVFRVPLADRIGEPSSHVAA